MAKKRMDESLTDEGLQYNIGISFVMRINLILYKCYNYKEENDIQSWIKQLDALLLEVDAKLSDKEVIEANDKLNNIYKLLNQDLDHSNGKQQQFSAKLVGSCREFERFLRRTKFITELNVPDKAFDTSILV